LYVELLKYPYQPRRRFIMALQFRRVVTGHDASGRAVVKIDEMAKNLPVCARPARRLKTARFSGSSSLLRERARAIIAPIRSTVPS
jgi:hypothetical protein